MMLLPKRNLRLLYPLLLFLGLNVILISSSSETLNHYAYRTNFCPLHQKVEKKEIKRQNALKGVNISIAIWSEIDEQNPHLDIRILNELARRAQFSYTTYITGQPKANETWTDTLIRDTQIYDLAVNWFDRTSERIQKGIIFPTSWFNSDVIIVVKKIERDAFSFWAFSKPFSAGLWILTLVTITLTGILFYFLDFLQARADRSKMFTSLEGSVFTSFYSFAGSRSVFVPKSTASRILIVSMAFLYLILASAYTAKLTNFFIIKNRPTLNINDISDVISNHMSICIARGYANSENFKKRFIKARVVEIDTGDHEDMLIRAISDEKCDVGLVTIDGFDRYKIDTQFNPGCDLSWVGRRVFVAGSGFALSDSEVLCSSLLDNVLDYHLLQMQAEGVIDDIKDAFRTSNIASSCLYKKDLDENDDSVSVLNMAGAFGFHCCLMFISILFGLREYYRQPKEVKQRLEEEVSTNIKRGSEMVRRSSVFSSFQSKTDPKTLTDAKVIKMELNEESSSTGSISEPMQESNRLFMKLLQKIDEQRVDTAVEINKQLLDCKRDIVFEVNKIIEETLEKRFLSLNLKSD